MEVALFGKWTHYNKIKMKSDENYLQINHFNEVINYKQLSYGKNVHANKFLEIIEKIYDLRQVCQFLRFLPPIKLTPII